MTEELLLIRSLTAGDVASAIALEQNSPGAWPEEALAGELHRPGGWQYIGLYRTNASSACKASHEVKQPHSVFEFPPIKDYRGAQMRERGLSAIHQVCGQADDKADALPCGLLPVCYACGHVVGQEAELYRIAVASDLRRQGLGTFFLYSLLRSLGQNGVTSCWLEVCCSNSAAIGLYRKLGFTKEMVRKNYYADPPEDAIIMQWISTV